MLRILLYLGVPLVLAAQASAQDEIELAKLKGKPAILVKVDFEKRILIARLGQKGEGDEIKINLKEGTIVVDAQGKDYKLRADEKIWIFENVPAGTRLEVIERPEQPTIIRIRAKKKLESL
jgi:hypothetical protein